MTMFSIALAGLVTVGIIECDRRGLLKWQPGKDNRHFPIDGRNSLLGLWQAKVTIARLRRDNRVRTRVARKGTLVELFGSVRRRV